MSSIFSDEVATRMSYEGKGQNKKKPFEDLRIKSCVFSIYDLIFHINWNYILFGHLLIYICSFFNLPEAARLYNKELADTEITKRIGAWLSGAKLRLTRSL